MELGATELYFALQSAVERGTSSGRIAGYQRQDVSGASGDVRSRLHHECL